MLRDKLTQHQQILKYFVIGASASALDVVLFFIVHNGFHASALVAQSISVPTSVIYSFSINARHNFHTNDHMSLRLFSFCIVALIGYLAGYAIIAAGLAFALDANIGKILSLPVVFVIQYFLNSRVTFYKTRPGLASGPAQLKDLK